MELLLEQAFLQEAEQLMQTHIQLPSLPVSGPPREQEVQQGRLHVVTAKPTGAGQAALLGKQEGGDLQAEASQSFQQVIHKAFHELAGTSRIGYGSPYAMLMKVVEHGLVGQGEAPEGCTLQARQLVLGPAQALRGGPVLVVLPPHLDHQEEDHAEGAPQVPGHVVLIQLLALLRRLLQGLLLGHQPRHLLLQACSFSWCACILRMISSSFSGTVVFSRGNSRGWLTMAVTTTRHTRKSPSAMLELS
ncbi:hypothetical protein MC885_020218 [Smutsia gigantea]|nr:hypothetical protein MC885_020218 [Smutsia gigantea]